MSVIQAFGSKLCFTFLVFFTLFFQYKLLCRRSLCVSSVQLLFSKNGELFCVCYLVVLRSVSIVNMLNVLREAYGSVLFLIYALSDFVKELIRISYVSVECTDN